MKEKKNDLLEYVDKIIEREIVADYKKTKGTIVMRNGFIFQVDEMFNYFRDSWFFYVKASLEVDEEKKIKLLLLSNDGIVTNGDITLDLSEVATMLVAGAGQFHRHDDVPDYPFDDEIDELSDDSDDNFFGPN